MKFKIYFVCFNKCRFRLGFLSYCKLRFFIVNVIVYIYCYKILDCKGGGGLI